MKHLICVLVILAIGLNSFAEESLTDLPGFGPGSQTGSSPLPPPPGPPRQSNQEYVGSVAIRSISRKAGGTVYRVDMVQPMPLQRFEIRVASQQVKIISAQVTTDLQVQVAVERFSNTDVLDAGTVFASETLNQKDRISSIEMVMESFGSEADVTLTAVTDKGIPALILKESSPLRPPPPKSPRDVRLRVGDPVVSGPLQDGRYVSGTIVELYDGQRALVRDEDDNHTYVRSFSQLGKSILCDTNKDICNGDPVLSGPLSRGQYVSGYILDVYSNGKVKVRDDDDHENYIRDVNTVFTETRCHDDKCEGDDVLSGPLTDGRYLPGMILRVYSNGIFAVRDTADYDVYYRNSKYVLRGIGCEPQKGICEGDYVRTGPTYGGRFYRGRVVGVYSSTIIAVQDDDNGQIYVYDANVLRKY
ncbi:MAG: beta-sandwich domain-containing protein [Bdellovibrio sp.]|nr:beta-sandwich domain-containing protein [Bdellovibrio sp.]